MRSAGARTVGFTDVVARWPRAAGWYAGDEKMPESIAGQLPQLRLLPTRRHDQRCTAR
jgi:hypothetical protein